MRADNVLESEVITLFEQGDNCPVCRSMEKSVDGWVIGAFSDLLHNESAREQLRENGLCREHLKRIVELAREKSDVGSLAVSIIFRELLVEQLLWLEDSKGSILKKRRKPVDGSCVLCSVAAQSEKIYLSAFCKFLDRDEVRRSYEESSAVFCLGHSKHLVEKVSRQTREWLITVQKNKYGEVAKEIDDFVSKHDYRNESPIGPERNAWVKASRIIGEKHSTEQ